ncbi:radical SAM protein [archaeon]|nr:radical SAM protein [archaeon]
MTSHLFRLGLILTYRCNAECRHCFFESSPRREETIPLELGIKAIDEATKLGAEWISLTGGEPFLEPVLVSAFIKHASKSGLKTEIVSNGYWATSVQKATRILEPLKTLGLDALNLSIDDFHQEYIPITSVKNAYWAAHGLGIKIIIMTTTTKNNKITPETIPELLGDEKIQVLGGNRIHDPHALLIETPVTPVGRGLDLAEHNYTLFSEVKCGEVLRDIGLGPDGIVYPCCGPLASKITLGNINDKPLKKILEEAEQNPFYASIREGTSVSGVFTSKCHACLSVRE